MKTVSQFLFVGGIFLLGVAVKWGLGWAFFAGFVLLLLACLVPGFVAFFTADR